MIDLPMPAYHRTVDVPTPSLEEGIAALLSAGHAGDLRASLEILRRDPAAVDLAAMLADGSVVAADVQRAIERVLSRK